MYENGAILTTEDGTMAVLAGATLGGGTRINWCASFKTPPHVRWVKFQLCYWLRSIAVGSIRLHQSGHVFRLPPSSRCPVLHLFLHQSLLFPRATASEQISTACHPASSEYDALLSHFQSPATPLPPHGPFRTGKCRAHVDVRPTDCRGVRLHRCGKREPVLRLGAEG